MRKFEKISRRQFEIDVPEGNYNEIIMPKRGTKFSAGYDFYSIMDIVLNPGERKIIPTGIKCMMNDSEYLAIYVRSSLGFRYNIRMCNQVGIIDKDYYGNKKNDGHIMVALQNEGDEVVEIKKGDRFVQGIFTPYYVTDDDMANGDRIGGIGSTNGDDKNE